MPHSDDEVVALAALGEVIPADDSAHLSSCPGCRLEVHRLQRVVAAARVELVPGPAVAPPPRVWEAIVARTSAPVGEAAAPEPTPRETGPHPSGRGVATVTPLPRRPRHRPTARRVRWPIVAVAASALLVGGVAGSVGTRLLGRDPAPRVVASTTLAGLPLAPTATGRAAVLQTSTGPRLDVDVSRLGAQPGHFYEVWLIDREIHKMVAIGILRGATGEFVIPDGVNLRDYPLVDISVQLPGDPKHSGKSVLRGTIDA